MTRDTLNPGRRAERDGRARRRREDLRDVEFSSSREPRYDSHARRDHRDPRDFEGSWWSVPRDPRDQRDPRSVPRPRPPGASGVPAPPSWSLEREPREPREPRPARTVLQNNITKSSPKLNEKNIRRRGAETIQWWCMRMPWGNIVGKCGKEDADTYHLS